MQDLQKFYLVCTKPTNRYSSTMSSYQTASSTNGCIYSNWLSNLLQVVDINNWHNEIQNDSTTHNADFDVRARTLDLILYLYVKSTSVLEQHAALFVRQNHTSYLSFGNL